VNVLADLITAKKPDFCFLMETLCSHKRMEVIKAKVGFDYVFPVGCVGRSGGLAMMWKKELPVWVVSYSRNRIDLVFLDEMRVDRWRLTGYYAFLEKERRREAWDFVRDIAIASSLPWFIVGDFNDIVEMHEKPGQSDRDAWMLSGFVKLLMIVVSLILAFRTILLLGTIEDRGIRM